ncbi:MAG TPA: LPS assembly lipoprotein LptE [Ferruginibacter sp.]|nr:LPS assembly lipoprotein LptE [Ferruginibacter sp.]HMP21616.1 LPS assembly lipoprotein LptE [Ferruginibacter sp.]
MILRIFKRRQKAGAGYWILGVRCWTLDTGYRLLGAGYRMLVNKGGRLWNTLTPNPLTRQPITRNPLNTIWKIVAACICTWLFSYASCKYSFKDVGAIPQDIKTFRVNYLENKARYINPQLSPQLTERLKQKIIGNTRLRQTNDDDAHYDISGFVSDYSITTSGISGNTTELNRLNVTFHLVFKNTVDEKKNFETDVTSNFDFSGNKSLQEAETELNDDIIRNIVDAVFNKIFSNW